MRIFFKGFNFSQDGPGNRLVYHLQGCNMHCPWCSNPEGMSLSGGYEISVSEIVDECIRSRPMFFSGGGVTFTGGEATMQADELIDALKQLRAAGIHTALETNGISKRIPDIQEHVDYLMMDFKHYDAESFRKFTGACITSLLDNFEYLCAVKRQLHIRIPLINHVNTDDPDAFAQYFSRFDTTNVVFELLPYHEYGKSKWTSEYRITDGFVTADRIASFRRSFESCNLKLINT